MKELGVILIIAGLLGGFFAFNMETSVPTGVAGGMFGVERVNNLGLMEQRRNYLMVSGLSLVIGVLLYGFASMKASRVQEPDDRTASKACPYCAERIKVEAVICRHCGRDLPRPTPAEVDTRTDHQKFECWLSNQNPPITLASLSPDEREEQRKAFDWAKFAGRV